MLRTLFLFLCIPSLGLSQTVEGNAIIKAPAGSSEIVITTTNRLAGAIHSLKWNGQEFIDSTDHGRQLQSASSFGDGKIPHWAESYNPTEAGSRKDSDGPTSTSRLLFLKKSGNELQTITRMAFWLTPEEKSEGHPALNKTKLSDHILTKRVQLGYRGNSHIIPYQVTFSTPIGEQPAISQFEALTGYMPIKFDQFWKFNPASNKFETLSREMGEQTLPVTLASADGKFAMGILGTDQSAKGFGKPSYGRFYFPAEKVTKWNCVYRQHTEKGLPPGDYSFSMFVLVGTLEDVRQAYIQLLK
ncbi:hypothetical protein KIH39_00325 [Telmatocola sphagniphila]|uniref:Uncharacterized protein n=1 Tax=Telmatocola sphagniphila TaxID=1123043 RepID=A0A8E6B614_9BACT|nr:hypothetical protein [Telmatocola sphagniphila]QVL32401.1 hypothetical protein KIH39_00325 [Telmatocola sphagniphila]